MIRTGSVNINFADNPIVEKIEDGEFSGVHVSVRMVRRYGFYILTLYVPTILLITIAYATFFFNPSVFQPRIIVALTSLLVLSSLFTQVRVNIVESFGLTN